MLEDQLAMMKSAVRKEMRRSGSTKELFTGKQYRKAIIIAVGKYETSDDVIIPILNYYS